jgi:hypothetical protein
VHYTKRSEVIKDMLMPAKGGNNQQNANSWQWETYIPQFVMPYWQSLPYIFSSPPSAAVVEPEKKQKSSVQKYSNPYKENIADNKDFSTFFPAANQALKKLIINMYDAHVADLLTNKTYGILAAEQEEHEKNLIDFFDKNPHIVDEDKALVTEWYNKKFVAKDKNAPETIADLARTKLTPTSNSKISVVALYEENRQQNERNEIERKLSKRNYQQIEQELSATKFTIDRKTWVEGKKIERAALIEQINNKINQPNFNTTDLLNSFLVFNYHTGKQEQARKKIGEGHKPGLITKNYGIVNRSANILFSNIINFVNNSDPEEWKNVKKAEVSSYEEQIENNKILLLDKNDKLKKLDDKLDKNKSEIKSIKDEIATLSQERENLEQKNTDAKNDAAEYDKFIKSTEALKKAELEGTGAYFQELLEQISIELNVSLRALEKEQEWAVNGRVGFILPFAIFTGTTMAGALVTMAIEWENPITLSIFSIIALPLFIFVAIANWYIVKNHTNIIRQFLTEKKTAWEWFLIIFGMASTILSVAYTYYATKVFIDSLVALDKNSDNQTSDGEMIEVFEFDSALDIGIFFISALAGLSTGLAYFAIMHYYNRMISWKLLPEKFEKIGNLAVIANINWDTYITKQVLVKLFLGLTFIVMGTTFAPAFLASGIVLASAALAYILATAFHYYLCKAVGKNDQRTFMHVQLALILIMSLASIFFLMWAALPVLTVMAFGSVPVAITLLVMSWLGTACLYTLSTTGTFENILKKNINMNNLAANAPAEMQTICNETITTSSIHVESWVEYFWEGIKIGNGVGNGLPAMVGGWDFADDEGFGDNMPVKILLSGTMFAYASGISYACNYNGIERDSNYNGAIFYKQEQMMLINTVRRCYPNFERATKAIDDYLKDNPANWRNHNKRAVCNKVLSILNSINKNVISGTCDKLTDKEIKTLQSDGKLAEIYAQVLPFLEVAQLKANQATIRAQLKLLISDLEAKYINVRSVEGNFSYTLFGQNVSNVDTSLIPAIPKTTKENAATTLLNNLKKIEVAIESNEQAELEKFTPDQMAALTQGRLAEYFSRATKLLLPSYIPLHDMKKACATNTLNK